MENVTQNSNNNKGGKKMDNLIRKNEIMGYAINDFILSNRFLMQYIIDKVEDKIYNTKEYHDSMIQDVLENDLNNSYSLGYIVDGIIDNIDIYALIDRIDYLYSEYFKQLARDCNN